MRINEIQVKNFRLLEDISISLDDVTLVVGRNNSGKTSLIDIFCKFLSGEKTRFKFEDFSLNSHEKFKRSLELWNELEGIKKANGSEEEIANKEKEFKETIPVIVVTLQIEYEEEDNLASLSAFIMDLESDRKDACIEFEYAPHDSERLFQDFTKADDEDFINFLRKNYNLYYCEKIHAIDRKNVGNRRLIEKKTLVSELFLSSFIYAQRHIDDQALESSKKLSKSFEDYYNDHHKDKEISEKLQNILDGTSNQWDALYKDIFKILLSDLKSFGYPGLDTHELAIKSCFDVEKVLKGSTNVFYQQSENNFLPESYNGLGFKNLIYIILQFITFFEKYKSREPKPDFHLLFIEEPEAHLHPQMQYTFIKNIWGFIKSKTGWNAQIIITTHSSHIVAESGFKAIRYFDNAKGFVNVKDLYEFAKKETAITTRFLSQHMSLSNCDMFFADKIIMIEGTVERLLLPLMIKRVDKKYKTNLSSQYISLIEVGGAYAHKFKGLLDFIGVRTLIVTDIDTVDSTKKRRKCKVAAGDKTSNQALVQWIPMKESTADLLTCGDLDKIQGNIRVTYQIPENGETICARSFEEAFILKNSALLADNEKLVATKELFESKDEQAVKVNSYELAEAIPSKTDFAFDIMLLGEWETPKYIEEGLLWLAMHE